MISQGSIAEITVPVSIKPTVEHRRERIRVDVQPGKAYVPVCQGGEGSGNFGHEGRPGEVGGSGEGGGSITGRDTIGHNKIKQIESQIHSRSSEHAAIYSKDGKQISVKGGSSSSVSFTNAELSEMKDCILTHNHPSTEFSRTLSPADYGVASKGNLSELRAVSGDKVYLFIRGENGWPAPSKVADSLATHLEKNAKRVYPLIKSGQITKSEGETKVWSAAWRATAQELGFGYTVEARK